MLTRLVPLCCSALVRVSSSRAVLKLSREQVSRAHLLQGREVALCEKPVLPGAGCISPDPCRQLDGEWVLAGRLRHPLHLVQLLEVLRAHAHTVLKLTI